MKRKKDGGLVQQSPVQKVHAPGGRMFRSNRVIGPGRKRLPPPVVSEELAKKVRELAKERIKK